MSRTRDAADALLPRGRAWTLLRASALGRLLDACVAVLEALEARAVAFLSETTPDTATELLARWEYLVDSPGAATLELRRTTAVQRLVPPADVSLATLITDAAAIGYAITPTEYDLFRAGSAVAGDAVRDEPWVHTLDIGAPRGADDLALRSLVDDRTPSHVLVRMQWT